MRSPILAALLLVLSACWTGKPSGGDAGTAGTGGEGGEGSGCATCGRVAFQGEAASALCQASSPLFAKIQGCACDAGSCGVDCAGSLCSSAAADAVCEKCLMSKCASDFAVCSNDKATN